MWITSPHPIGSVSQNRTRGPPKLGPVAEKALWSGPAPCFFAKQRKKKAPCVRRWPGGVAQIGRLTPNGVPTRRNIDQSTLRARGLGGSPSERQTHRPTGSRAIQKAGHGTHRSHAHHILGASAVFGRVARRSRGWWVGERLVWIILNCLFGFKNV